MVFQTDANLERAKALTTAGDEASLQYAALELRIALEKIAYSKLQMRLSGVPHDELRKWQPKRVIDMLMQLVDPEIDRDISLRISPEDAEGRPTTWHHLGNTKGVSPRNIGAYWQKLGALLHARMPKTKEDDIPPFSVSPSSAQFLSDVADYIADTTASQFDAHFSNDVNFECIKCAGPIARNIKTLRQDEIVTCANPSCGFMYRTIREKDEFTFHPIQYKLECANCERTLYIDGNRVLGLDYHERLNTQCECGSEYTVGWKVHYSPVREAKRDAEGGGTL